MTKSKKQLRAEAVERLKTHGACNYSAAAIVEALTDVYRMQGDKTDYRVEIASLIDLLTDDEPSAEKIDEKNHLIAKARNSFKSLADCALDADRMRNGCRIACERMDEEMERMGIALDGRRTKPTNVTTDETNGIGTSAPLADELPEGDAVSIMRELAHDATVTSIGERLHTIHLDDSLNRFADMVERDYVRREERDELRAKLVDVQHIYMR